MPRFVLSLFLSLLVLPALADEYTPLSAEVLWQLQRLASPVVSPDGSQVVVQATRYPDDNKDPESRLWLLSTGKEPLQRPLTAPGGKASDPVFSPDGSMLAFVSKRGEEEQGQVYLLPMNGPGEATPLTDIPTGVSALRWVAEHIYFISSVWPDKTFEEMREHLEAKKDDKLSAMAWDHLPYSYWDHFIDQDRENHLFRVPASGGDIEPLTQAIDLPLPVTDAGLGDYSVAPDGKTIAMVADSAAGEPYPNPDVYLFSVGDKAAQNLTGDNAAADYAPQFSPDGRELVFQRTRIPGFYADNSKLMRYQRSSGKTTLLHEDWDYSMAGLKWAADSKSLYGAIDDRGTRRIYRIPLGSSAPSAITAATDFDSLSVAANGTVIGRNQSGVYPPRVVSIDPRSGRTRRLDTFNDDVLESVDMGSYESVTYTGADGHPIQMWVHYPPGFDKSREYPLFLLIHGGPHGAVTDDFHFRWNAQTFSSWGYVTAWPNFHGSTGFGQDFTDSINPDWANKPYEDVIKAAEWFEDQPWIDAERMVAGGGSYGGYLSTILLGREHPFNALLIHAAVYDLYAQMSSDFAVHSERFGPYWERPEIYKAFSPHYYADKFNTPSLIIHGQKDLRVPVGQAFELFRTLQMRGVESRLVYYPDENHWILSRANSLNWYEEVKNWIARFAEPGPR